MVDGGEVHAVDVQLEGILAIGRDTSVDANGLVPVVDEEVLELGFSRAVTDVGFGEVPLLVIETYVGRQRLGVHYQGIALVAFDVACEIDLSHIVYAHYVVVVETQEEVVLLGEGGECAVGEAYLAELEFVGQQGGVRAASFVVQGYVEAFEVVRKIGEPGGADAGVELASGHPHVNPCGIRDIDAGLDEG